MHPVSTVFLIAGYALAVPIALRMVDVVREQHRLSLVGHQIGVAIALAGWVFRGTVTVAAIHLCWMMGVKLWFSWSGSRSNPTGRP